MTINMAVNSCLYFLLIQLCIYGLTLDLVLGITIEGPIPDHFNETEYIAEKGDNVTLVCSHESPIVWTHPNNTDAQQPSISYTHDRQKFKGTIRIYNVDHQEVGFYTCMETGDPLKNMSTYLYVEGASQLYVEENNFLTGQEFRPLIVPCRPTSPNVHVELYQSDCANDDEEKVSLNQKTSNGETWSYDRRYGFEWENPVSMCPGTVTKTVSCDFKSSEKPETTRNTFLCDIIKHYNFMNMPEIKNGTSEDYFAEGYPLNLTCVVSFDDGRTTPNLKWFKDEKQIKTSDRIYIPTKPYWNNNNASLYLSIQRLIKATDEGTYSCLAYDAETNSTNSIDVNIQRHHFINISEENNIYNITQDANKEVTWSVYVSAFPRADIEWINNQNKPIRSDGKYTTSVQGKQHILKIHDVTVSDIGKYTIKASNTNTKNASLYLLVRGPPNVEINVKPFNLVNTNSTINCSVIGYPQPEIQLFFKSCKDCMFEEMTPQKADFSQHTANATISIQRTQSGTVRCVGSNSLGKNEIVKPFVVTDVEDGFQIWVEENDEEIRLNRKAQAVKMANEDEVTFFCASTKQNYTDKIEWFYNDTLIDDNMISKSVTKYSYKIQFSIKSLNIGNTGKYTCKSERNNAGIMQPEGRTMKLTVTAPEEPTIIVTNLKQKMNNLIFPNAHELYCISDGVPRPRITWKKDGHDYIPDGTRVKLENNSQQIYFSKTNTNDEGTYECIASNKVGNTKLSAFVGFSNTGKMNPFVYGIIAILFFAILIVLICLCIRLRKENELKRMLRSVGLEHFEKGQIESLNPEIGIDDQAELLPYHKDHWEIPRENIKLGKQLGAGAFGIVMKAEAIGVNGDKESTTVAVKMVKKNVDCSYLKALCSELKIMSHLGSHVNVVNLIGACTENIAKCELLVVVEFCRFGNLHNYLLRHRGNFINQIDPDSNIIDYNIGADLLERSFSVSSNQSQDSGGPKDMQDYRENSNNTSHTQYTATTTVCMTPTGQDEPLTSNNSVQPEWRSNYKGDYKGKIKPISTKDLLTWAFQVARGMEYLASRKVLHGDLAARNILLSDNNIVKICDFGLAKRMYKDDNYKKQNNSPLPIKWMAIESITDRIFSTQSDVWSFGIVMWEFFSLAKTPYPGMEADERLYHKLVSGYRMDCPPYATSEIYAIMADCWETKPLRRPTFSQLSDRIGSLLEQAVLRHYIDLNDPYLQMNTKLFEDIQNDYLQMASPPDFASLSSPQYINYDSGISSPTPGQPYMLMKPGHIFSPRILVEGEVFNFEDIKKNSRMMECMEMTPMLNLKDLDNLSKPNSPEPNEMPSYSNPGYNKMPLIKEDVLKTKDNYVNMPQNKSKTDFLNISDKTNDASHHYVNSVSRDWERNIITA